MRCRLGVVPSLLAVALLAACGGGGGSRAGDDDGAAHAGPSDAGGASRRDASTVVPAGTDAGQTTPYYNDGLPSFLPLPPLGQFPAVQTRLPQIDLQIDPAYLAALDANPVSDAMFAARMLYDGIGVDGTLRYRGESTRTLPQKSFKFKLDRGHVDHRDKFDLLAEYLDSGKLAEKFSIDLRTAMGVRAPPGQFVQVSVNGRPNGLYLDMMKVHNELLLMFGLEVDSHVFTCGGRNCEMKLAPPGRYQQDYEYLDAFNGSQQPELQELLRFINRTDDAEFEAGIGTRIDLEGYLDLLASRALMSDSIVEDTKGWWIYETRRGRWSFVPWDLNNCMMVWYRTWAPTDAPIVDRDARVFTVWDDTVQLVYDKRKTVAGFQPTWSVLNTRLWRRPAFRNRILDKIDWALSGPFSIGRAGPHLDALWAVARPALYQDPFFDQPHADVAIDFYRSFVTGRSNYLRGQLPLLRDFQGALVINEIGFGDAATPGYVELYNSGSADIDLGGYAVTDDLRAFQKQILPAGLVVPARGYLRLVADGNTAAGIDHLAFTIPTSGGEIGLFDGVQVIRPFDLAYFGPHPAGSAYGRYPDASESYKVMPQTPGAPNR